MDFSSEIGLERLQRAVAIMVAQGINAQIDAQNTLWAPKDTAFYAAIGRSNPITGVEHIAADNVYSGTIPSLITSPASAFPNCSVIAYVATPTGANEDVMERYSETLALEFMVKSLTNEEEVNARIHRTLEAAHALLLSDGARRIPELDGGNLVPEIGQMPNATISDVFVRHTSSDPNDRSFYQHGSLVYRVDKFSGYPGG